MRPEKADIVKDLAKDLKESSFVLVTDYQHMQVDDFSELRKRLAAAGAEVHVVKNSFLKRAMADSGLTAANGELTGQTAVVTGEKDVAPVAKILKTFAGQFKKAILKLGFIDRAQVATKEIEQLADLPPREVLQAQLLGLFLSPATKFVRLLNEPGPIAGIVSVPGDKICAFIKRAGIGIRAIVESERRKGGPARRGNAGNLNFCPVSAGRNKRNTVRADSYRP